MKRKIQLRESDLTRLVMESVRRIIRESNGLDPEVGADNYEDEMNWRQLSNEMDDIPDLNDDFDDFDPELKKQQMDADWEGLQNDDNMFTSPTWVDDIYGNRNIEDNKYSPGWSALNALGARTDVDRMFAQRKRDSIANFNDSPNFFQADTDHDIYCDDGPLPMGSGITAGMPTTRWSVNGRYFNIGLDESINRCVNKAIRKYIR